MVSSETRQLIAPSQVAVIMLNYNNAQDTIECIESIRRLSVNPKTIIIADNCSTDCSQKVIYDYCNTFTNISILEEDFSGDIPTGFILLRIKENNGFASGNNAAIRMIMQDKQYKAVWIINNDTAVHNKSLEALIEKFNSDGEHQIIGSTIVYKYSDKVVQCASGSRLNTMLGTTVAICEGMLLNDVLEKDEMAVEDELSDVRGASMFIGMDVFRRIGLFDEAFFLYVEETEFCVRARKAGYRLGWAKDSVVFHKEGGSTGAKSDASGSGFVRPKWVDYLGLRNRVHMMKKHYPLSLILVCLSYVGVVLNRIRRKQYDRILLVVCALYDGLTGNMYKHDRRYLSSVKRI